MPETQLTVHQLLHEARCRLLQAAEAIGPTCFEAEWQNPMASASGAIVDRITGNQEAQERRKVMFELRDLSAALWKIQQKYGERPVK